MRITVVGIGADGWSGLDAARRWAILEADVVLGGPRQLELLPADVAAERAPWPSPLRAGLADLLAVHAGRRIAALASGDPLIAGVGTTLIDLLGAENVTVLPAVSSAAIARARLGWSAEDVTVLRDPRTVVRHLAPRNRILVLSTDGSTPQELRDVVGDAKMTILADLDGPDERIEEFAGQEVPNLHVLAIECGDGPSNSWAAGLPDSAFDHDGQITKRDLRASALARLSPMPGQLLWDVGAGAGSVAIEWLRAHPTCRAIAIEARSDRAKRIGENALALGVPHLEVIEGHAPEALSGLEAPDAIFVGGGATEAGVIDGCWAALRPGGRIVIHGVTLETEHLLAEQYAQRGGELSRLHVEHAAPIGSFTGWTPSRAITQWSAVKE